MTTLSRGLRSTLLAITTVALIVVYTPLALVLLNSFNTNKSFAWPPTGLTLRWWKAAAGSEGARSALLVSLEVAILATLLSLLLGTMAALALQRYRFFGRNAVSLLILLPIALPGIVTVYNNVIARLRRTAWSQVEASMDLGADGFQTFRYVVLPNIATALLAGGLLAFALSFDEIIVTTFTAGPGVQTLPIWIYQNLARPNQAPIVNVVAALLIVLSVIPVWLAQRLSADTSGGRL